MGALMADKRSRDVGGAAVEQKLSDLESLTDSEKIALIQNLQRSLHQVLDIETLGSIEIVRSEDAEGHYTDHAAFKIGKIAREIVDDVAYSLPLEKHYYRPLAIKAGNVILPPDELLVHGASGVIGDIQHDLLAEAEPELSEGDIANIKSQVLEMIRAELLDTPENHLGFIRKQLERVAKNVRP